MFIGVIVSIIDIPGGRISFILFFEKIYISNELGLRKPDAECFAHVCNDIGLPPQEVLFLDDTKEHVLGAHKVGIIAQQVTGNIEASQILVARLSL